MKKLVTILLVLAMALSLSGVAFAATFSDTADLPKATQSSIAKLAALDIINGYPDGTFKPANNITRAEFAKIATIIAGMQSSATALQNTPSQYPDVVAGSWYMGWVNLSSSQGFMKGYPDGTFHPNATITNAEVVTVLLRILGYNDNLPGPWPVDYIAKAAALDITEDVAFDAAAPAKRADVAVMVDATLDTVIVSWDVDNMEFDEDEDDTKLIEDSFEAAVNSDFIMGGTEMDDDVWSIDVEATDEDDDDFDGNYDLAADVAISDGGLVTWLDWAIADILYNDDDEEIVYIEITSSAMVVDGEDITFEEDDDEIEILDKTYDFAEYFEDNTVFDPYDTAIDDDAAYRVFINEDDEVYRMTVRTEASPAIVDEYKTSTEKLTFKYRGTYYDDSASIDLTDEDVLIEKAGAFIAATDLKAGDVLYIDPDTYGYDYYIDVRTMTATGTLQAWKEGQVKIGGTWYDFADENAVSRNAGEDFDFELDADGLEDVYGETVTYFMNKALQIVFVSSDIEGTDSNQIYGVVVDILDANYGGDVSRIKVLNVDGEEVSYDIDTDEVELADAAEGISIDDFIKFSVNDDNDIDGLTILASVAEGDVVIPDADIDEDYTDEDNEDYVGVINDGDTDNDRIHFENGVDTWLYVTDDTVIFNGYYDEDDDEAAVEDNGDVVDWAENTLGEDEISAAAYVQYDGNKIEFIYLYDEVESDAAEYAVVLDEYIVDNDPWVDVDILGVETSYESNEDLADMMEGVLYDYSISNDKFNVEDEIFDPEAFAEDVAADVYNDTYDETDYMVTDVDIDGEAVEIDGEWFYADEDTIVYDYSDYYDDGDDPAYMADGIADINEDDLVIVIGDEDNVVDLFIIVNNVEGYVDYEDMI